MEAPSVTPVTQDPATHAKWSVALFAAVLVFFSLPLITTKPGALIWLPLVIAGLYPLFVSLYRTEIERPSFELETRPRGRAWPEAQARARARAGAGATVGVVDAAKVGGATIRISIQSGQRCPYCHDELVGTSAAEMLTCGACQTVLHRDCLKELGSCPTHGCRNRRAKKSA